MFANRLSWVGVAVVVLVVGILVVRTVRQDDSLRGEETRLAPANPAAGGKPSPERSVAGNEPVQSGVHRAKEALKTKGYYSGPVDGNFDPPVIEALKAFQKDAGLHPTGYLDSKTYAALGIEVKRRP